MLYNGGNMKEQWELRLEELREEFDSGQKMLADLEERVEELKRSLLRIEGAIQVLEELGEEDIEEECFEDDLEED